MFAVLCEPRERTRRAGELAADDRVARLGRDADVVAHVKRERLFTLELRQCFRRRRLRWLDPGRLLRRNGCARLAR